MPRTLYCWRCQIEVPMVTDEEWARIAPHLSNVIGQIKRYREENACSLAEANRHGFGLQALAVYREITGFAETNPNALYHHRISDHGPECKACGKPLRSPKAKLCAACGTVRGE